MKWFLRSKMLWGVVFYAIARTTGVEIPEEMRGVLTEKTMHFIDISVEVGALWLTAYGARKGAGTNLTVLPQLPWLKQSK